MPRPDRCSSLAALTALLGALVAPPARAADESREPPLLFAVTVGSATVAVREGEATRLAGSFDSPLVTVRPEPYRVFPYGGTTFRYPRSFSFEADLADPDMRTWTLSGNDFKLMLFAFSVAVTPEAQTRNVCESFGNCRYLDRQAKLRLGDVVLAGLRVEATVQGSRVVQEVYAVPTRGQGSRLLVLQDWPDDGATRSAEGGDALRLIGSSFLVRD